MFTPAVNTDTLVLPVRVNTGAIFLTFLHDYRSKGNTALKTGNTRAAPIE